MTIFCFKKILKLCFDSTELNFRPHNFNSEKEDLIATRRMLKNKIHLVFLYKSSEIQKICDPKFKANRVIHDKIVDEFSSGRLSLNSNLNNDDFDGFDPDHYDDFDSLVKIVINMKNFSKNVFGRRSDRKKNK